MGIAQDIHFSQFYHAPFELNPALTGAFNGDHRAYVNYKDQWGSVNPGFPFRTFAVSYDAALMKKKWDKAFLGAGVFFYNDVAGDSKLSTNKGGISLSCIMSLNEDQHIQAGIQGGFAQRSITTSGLIWDNQIDGNGHNSTLSSNDPMDVGRSDLMFGDVGAGVSWSYGADETNMISNDRLRINVGTSVFHPNRPKTKFAENLISADRLYPKFVAHAGAYIELKNTLLALKPVALYMRQGTAQEVNVGLLFCYIVREESRFTGIFKETAISLGAYYRLGDALAPAVLIEYANYAIGISYDVNLSQLTTASKAKGGLEITLRYISPNPFRHGKGTQSNVKFM